MLTTEIMLRFLTLVGIYFLGMKATQSMKKAINALCAVLSRVNVAIAQVPPN